MVTSCKLPSMLAGGQRQMTR